MSAAQLERLQEHMQRLRLFKSRDRLEALLQEATANEASFADRMNGDRPQRLLGRNAPEHHGR